MYRQMFFTQKRKYITAVVVLSVLLCSSVLYISHYLYYIKPYYWSISNELHKLSDSASINEKCCAIRNGVIIAQSMYPNNIPGSVSLYGGNSKDSQ